MEKSGDRGPNLQKTRKIITSPKRLPLGGLQRLHYEYLKMGSYTYNTTFHQPTSLTIMISGVLKPESFNTAPAIVAFFLDWAHRLLGIMAPNIKFVANITY